MSSNDGNNDSLSIDAPVKSREELINVATQFLQNPKVQQTSLAQRQSFLKSKGLTDEEIRLAMDRTNTLAPEIHTAVSVHPHLLPRQSLWSRFRYIANNIALVGGIVYAIYHIYKNYISQSIEKKKKKTLEKSVADLERSFKTAVQNVQDDIKKVSSDISLLNLQLQHTENSCRQIQELKTEFSSVKSILLSRSQFPVPEPAALSPSSIPSWQLSATNDATSVQPNIDICSDENFGSGSSEPELVNNNGSDSSLEMIKE